jgi:predicted enzyme related to lactoylglutathione lyase
MPTTAHGKICYIEIPAVDVSRSAAFYQEVFGWRVRVRGDGAVAFDDVGEVSGAWVLGKPAIDAGFVYIMTDDAARTCAAIERAGGAIVVPVDPQATEVIARFSDPAGNVFGLYQEPGLRR